MYVKVTLIGFVTGLAGMGMVPDLAYLRITVYPCHSIMGMYSGGVGNKGQALRARDKSHKGSVWQDEQDEAYRQREDNDIPGWDPAGPLAPEEGLLHTPPPKW